MRGDQRLEGMVAHIVSPELGAAFNGIQGDIWDAQKDVSLAMLGAIICMLITATMQKNASLRATIILRGNAGTERRGAKIEYEEELFVES